MEHIWHDLGYDQYSLAARTDLPATRIRAIASGRATPTDYEFGTLRAALGIEYEDFERLLANIARRASRRRERARDRMASRPFLAGPPIARPACAAPPGAAGRLDAVVL